MNFNVISLGCDKNRVDSEHIIALLCGEGFLYTDLKDADVIVVNTCAFIESAREEAVDTILECYAEKKNAAVKIVVTGCLAQKYADELLEALPEADAFVGIRDYEKLPEILRETAVGTRTKQVDGKCFTAGARVLSTPPHYAYLKIADGCDNRCTYCTIPSIRGAYVSRRREDIWAEADALVSDGVKELILVAQDVTAYGKDIYGTYALADLLRGLIRTDVHTIRLMYCYPELVTDELIELIAAEPKIAKYMDIPIQHISDAVLKRMGRRSDGMQIRTLFRKLRERGIAIRTTVMVGFPGETEEQFSELAAFLSDYKPDRVGVFAYSLEEDTPSARLDGHLSAAVKLKRVNKIGRLFLHNAKERNRALVGKTIPVLYEDIDYERGLFKGRTESDAPDVDCNIYFKADFADVGNYYDVTVTGVDGYDLIGEIK